MLYSTRWRYLSSIQFKKWDLKESHFIFFLLDYTVIALAIISAYIVAFIPNIAFKTKVNIIVIKCLVNSIFV